MHTHIHTREENKNILAEEYILKRAPRRHLNIYREKSLAGWEKKKEILNNDR